MSEALPGEYVALADRFGQQKLADRLLRQASHWAKMSHQGEGLFRLEQFVSVDKLAAGLLRATGLAPLAYRNFLDVRAVHQTWVLRDLPEAFDGFRLLQLSDLHLDLDPALVPRIRTLIEATAHDAAVVTGDFRNSTDADYGPGLQATLELIPSLAESRFGILGNHDFIEIVWGLEAGGLPMLLNEGATIRRGTSLLWIAGVDDPHFYRTHDFEASCKGAPPGSCKVLLCHSPEPADEASRHGFSLCLCGHTHGGQLCLPGGIPLVVPVRDLPRNRICGRWQSGAMQGYTSPGTGSCGVPARLNCPPEITLHTLRCEGACEATAASGENP